MEDASKLDFLASELLDSCAPFLGYSFYESFELAARVHELALLAASPASSDFDWCSRLVPRILLVSSQIANGHQVPSFAHLIQRLAYPPHALLAAFPCY